MSNNFQKNDNVWPPPIHYEDEEEDESEIQTSSNTIELSPHDKLILHGRWIPTIAIAWNMVAFIWEMVIHVHHWWHLFTLLLLPLAIRGWRLKFRLTMYG